MELVIALVYHGAPCGGPGGSIVTRNVSQFVVILDLIGLGLMQAHAEKHLATVHRRVQKRARGASRKWMSLDIYLS
jgi:hypothetical protein